jgi:hypothetical protein
VNPQEDPTDWSRNKKDEFDVLHRSLMVCIYVRYNVGKSIHT